jgi:hypothetical protein
MNGMRWTTAGALAGVVGGVVLAVGVARSDARRAKRVRKRLRRETKRLRRETLRLARDTEEWLEHTRRHARLPHPRDARLGKRGAAARATDAISSRMEATRQAGADAAHRTRHLLTSAAPGSAYGKMRTYLRQLLMNGTMSGAILHALTSEGARSAHGLLESGRYPPAARAAAQRLGMHLLLGALAAFAFELLAVAERRSRR